MSSDSTSPIALLMRDASRHPLLGTEGTKQMAIEIVHTRAALWCGLLDYLPATSAVVRVLKREGLDDGIEQECRSVAISASYRRSDRCSDHAFGSKCRDLARLLAAGKGAEVARQLVADFVRLSRGQPSVILHRDMPADMDRALQDDVDIGAQADMLERLLARHHTARNVVVSSNVRLVVSIAKGIRHRTYGLTFDDAVQEGTIGLMRALDTYDPTRGFRLSTYASWWIRHMLVRAATDRGRLVRVPAHVHDQHRRMIFMARTLNAKLGRWPTPEETADAMGMSHAKAMAISEALGQDKVTSIDAPLFDEGDTTVGDITPLAERHDRDAESVMDAERSAMALREAMNNGRLTDREREVLRKHWGVGCDAEHLSEIGAAFDEPVSRERVRQIELHAMAKLRNDLKERVAWAG